MTTNMDRPFVDGEPSNWRARARTVLADLLVTGILAGLAWLWFK